MDGCIVRIVVVNCVLRGDNPSDNLPRDWRYSLDSRRQEVGLQLQQRARREPEDY
jgi:hypothetical protein